MNGTGVVSKPAQGVAIELDPQTSSRLLERALRGAAPLSVTFLRCDQEASADGHIESSGVSSLTIVGSDSSFDELLPSTCLEVRLNLDDQQFFFTSSVLSAEGRTVELTRPERLHTWQRRRFLRAEVADSASVSLTLPDVYTQPKGEGAILNLSRDGLACKVSRTLADRLSISETIGVVFELGAERTRIECNGKVKSKTVSGSAQATIVGIHFVPGPKSVEMDGHLARLLSP